MRGERGALKSFTFERKEKGGKRAVVRNELGGTKEIGLKATDILGGKGRIRVRHQVREKP